MRREDGTYIENEEPREDDQYTETVVLPSELDHPVAERRSIINTRRI